ncbi:tetratricopeptide repeat protein [Aquisphaera insulae]|uniref:tetratricopeptide repeat protein n=1 Tax=Aquisphaera insulae TaxID=2712864 RepID=UPI0013EBC73B|nr:tetratricopeptide repeat protein [Aquisphaera insulae]
MPLASRRRFWIVGLLLAAVGASIAWRGGGESPDRLFDRARTELAAGHPERAAAAIERLAARRPPTGFDRLLHAQIDEALSRPIDALDELARIPADDPVAPVARMVAGRLEMQRGRVGAAEAQYLACLAIQPDAVKARRELVYIYSVQHRQADLDRQLHELSERDSLEFAYLDHWGKTRNVVWSPERDCDELSRFIEADPDDRRSRIALVEGLRRMHRLDEAEKVIEPLPATDPEALALRGWLLLDRGELDALDRFLADSPQDDPRLAKLRGNLALKRGDGPTAVRFFRIAQAAEPADRSLNSGLANALRLAGQLEAAAPYLEAVRLHDAITPLITRASTDEGEKDRALPDQLAAACEAAGRLFEARAWYKLALSRDPVDAEAQQGFHRLGLRLAEARPPKDGEGAK